MFDGLLIKIYSSFNNWSKALYFNSGEWKKLPIKTMFLFLVLYILFLIVCIKFLILSSNVIPPSSSWKSTKYKPIFVLGVFDERGELFTLYSQYKITSFELSIFSFAYLLILLL